MFAINEEENTTQCKLIQHRRYGGRRAGKGTTLQKSPKGKYKARGKHTVHLGMDERGQRGGTGSKTPSLVGTFPVSKQVPHCNMVRPKDAAKQSSSSAYEQATTGHTTKQGLLGKSTS